MKLILYSKPGCHLCEGLAEKLRQVTQIPLELEIRDITTDPNWFDRYQYEIPVLYTITHQEEKAVPRISPRSSVQQIERLLASLSLDN